MKIHKNLVSKFPDELRDLANKTGTVLLKRKLSLMNWIIKLIQNIRYLVQKGNEDIKDAPEDTLTEDEYGDILDVILMASMRLMVRK